MTIGRNAFPDEILFIKNDMSFSDPYDVCPNILSLMTTVLKKKSKFGTKGTNFASVLFKLLFAFLHISLVNKGCVISGPKDRTPGSGQ